MAPVEALEDIRAALTTPPAPPLEPRGCPTPGACSCPAGAIVPPELIRALQVAEEALADIGDAERESGDDLAWAERRAAQELPRIRHALRTWRDHATPPAATREAGPLPQAPTDEDLDDLCAEFSFLTDDEESRDLLIEMFRAVLARWGGAAVPVAVSERLPGTEDLDAANRCWWFAESHEGRDTAPSWGYTWRSDDDTHWLPHWALPVPAAAAGEVQP
jgi:hypothetical protein